MFFDSIQNFIEHDIAIFPRLKSFCLVLEHVRNTSFEGLRSMDFGMLKTHMSFSQYLTEDETHLQFETHRIHWDLHIVMEGEEFFGVSPVEALGEPIKPYDEFNDISFYRGVTKNRVYLCPGCAILVAPWDAHKPRINSRAESRPIKKLVLKLPWGTTQQ